MRAMRPAGRHGGRSVRRDRRARALRTVPWRRRAPRPARRGRAARAPDGVVGGAARRPAGARRRAGRRRGADLQAREGAIPGHDTRGGDPAR